LIIHEGNIFKSMILQTFSPEGVNKALLELRIRSYKIDPLVYFRNTNYWLSQFRIITEFFQHLYMNFLKNVWSILIPSKHRFYSIYGALNVFSEISVLTVPLTTLLVTPGVGFTNLIHQFIAKRGRNKYKKSKIYILDKIWSYYDQAPADFWDYVYNPQKPRPQLCEDSLRHSKLKGAEKLEKLKTSSNKSIKKRTMKKSR